MSAASIIRALITEAASSSEMSVNVYQTKQCTIPKESLHDAYKFLESATQG
jgi:hypothetical protein